MDMTIRPYNASNADALSLLWNTVYPNDKLTAQELVHRDTFYLQPPYRFGRFVAEREGSLLGAGSYMQQPGAYHPQTFYLEINVYPAAEKQGIGGKLYQSVLDAIMPFNPLTLRGQVNERHKHARAFAQARGYSEGKRDWAAILDLNTFDLKPFDGIIGQAEAQGFTFRNLAELGDTPAVRQKFYELFSAVRRDAPRAEPVTDIPYDTFVHGVFEAPDFSPEGNIVVMYQDQYVGLTQLWKGSATDELFTGLTGVKRGFRGRHLALALKLKAIAFARAVAAPLIHTDNDTTNVAMLAINDKLGFARQPARISVTKKLTSGNAPVVRKSLR